MYDVFPITLLQKNFSSLSNLVPSREAVSNVL